MRVDALTDASSRVLATWRRPRRYELNHTVRRDDGAPCDGPLRRSDGAVRRIRCPCTASRLAINHAPGSSPTRMAIRSTSETGIRTSTRPCSQSNRSCRRNPRERGMCGATGRRCGVRRSRLDRRTVALSFHRTARGVLQHPASARSLRWRAIRSGCSSSRNCLRGTRPRTCRSSDRASTERRSSTA